MLVTAAFIGPGTVLTASQAGAKYGFSLLWAVVFATVSGIVLQEMAGRLGIATGSGFSQAIVRAVRRPSLRRLILGLVLVGILFGNSAFQTGNLLGAAAGISVLKDHRSEIQESNQASPSRLPRSSQLASRASLQTESPDSKPENKIKSDNQNLSKTQSALPKNLGALILIATVAGALILIGKYEWLQRLLTILVVFMSAMFLIAALLSWPSLSRIAIGLIPSVPAGSGWVIIGLIGTTVVPYNLFLHASAAAQRWPRETTKRVDDKEKAVADSAKNTRFAVGIGGLVTASILITAAVAFDQGGAGAALRPPATFTRAADIAVQLEPVLGSSAKLLFGLGLFAAGLTSAITAPVAAAYAVGGSLNWPNRLSDWRLKSVALVVLGVGFLFATLFGASPKEAVLMAQSLNGLLLPLLAILLLVIMNRVDLVTRFHNRTLQNGIAVIVIVVVTLIAARQVVIF
jgi:manganese transport protein